MKILIPPNDAIGILNECLKGLSTIYFNPKVWQANTITHVNEIFGPITQQSNQISFLVFETPVQSMQAKVLGEAKATAGGLILSFIEQIELYSKIQLRNDSITQSSFEKKYLDLTVRCQDQARKYTELKNLEITLSNSNKSLTIQLEESKRRIEYLEKNTLQLENITLNNLWKAIKNLPAKDVWALVGILVGFSIATFFLGEFIQTIKHSNISP
jgi:hypothetical protein